jgi:hypothetical protein
MLICSDWFDMYASCVLVQVGMISESIRSISRGFQLNPRDPLAVVSLLELIARERALATAEGINATAVVLVAGELSEKGDIRATKALAELYNSGGHYGRARELLVAALNSGKNSKQLEGHNSKVDPNWSAKCLLMNLAHAGKHIACVSFHVFHSALQPQTGILLNPVLKS